MKRTIIILTVLGLILIFLNGCGKKQIITLEGIGCGPSIVEGRVENCYVNANYLKNSNIIIECNAKVDGKYLPDIKYADFPSGSFDAWLWKDTIDYPHKVELCCKDICASCNVNPKCK